MIEKIIPNEFEFRILCYQEGYISSTLLIKIFLDKEIYMPSANQDEKPVELMSSGEKNNEKIAVFTSLNLLYFAAMEFKYRNLIPIKSYYTLTGREVLHCIPKKQGLSVNVGFNINFTLQPKDVIHILKNLSEFDKLPDPYSGLKNKIGKYDSPSVD